MWRPAFFLPVLMFHILMAGLPLPAAAAERGAVDAAGYEAFWLWGGVAGRAGLLDKARTLYVLQGEIRPVAGAPGGAMLLAQGAAVPDHLATPGHPLELWLVYRAETLAWPAPLRQRILARLERWRQAGNQVAGVQIDFDAATRGLPGYAEALRSLRRDLPPGIRLGITGLMDWVRNSPADGWRSLGGVIDEVVVQTYQGRRPIGDADRYLQHVGRLGLPFRIGLVEGGAWRDLPAVTGSPWFRGYVVFLLPPRP